MSILKFNFAPFCELAEIKIATGICREIDVEELEELYIYEDSGYIIVEAEDREGFSLDIAIRKENITKLPKELQALIEFALKVQKVLETKPS